MDRYSTIRGGSALWSNKSMASTIVNKTFWGNTNKFWVKVAGVWKACKAYVKVSGLWKYATPKTKVGGSWK